MPTRKAAPALGAGCTMVLKPAEQTPLSALAIMRLGEEAGLPPGVLNVVTGDADDAPVIGTEMTSNPIVRKLGFTGSTEVGKLLMAQCAAEVKKVSLELGGNAPFIVFDDADLDAAIEGALICKYRNSGPDLHLRQPHLRAGPGPRRLRRRASPSALREARTSPTGSTTVSTSAAHRPAGLREGRAPRRRRARRGAELLLGGSPHERGGQFFTPTVFAGVTDEMAMSYEETFGPVAGISRFTTEEEAVRKANDTPYGLSSYLYSRDMSRIWRVSEQLETGSSASTPGVISTEVAPFGGMKESGIGREGSKYGIDDWLETKYLCMAGV